MEKFLVYIKENYKDFNFLLLNSTLSLGLLILLYLTRILEIHPIPFHYIVKFFIVISFSYLLLNYHLSKHKPIYKKILTNLFFFALGLQICSHNSLQLSFNFLRARTFDFTHYLVYTNFLFFVSSISFILTNKFSDNKKTSTLKMNDSIGLLFLILILLGSTIIKAPYFNYDFTGGHPMKYNTYVEPAKYMVENRDFFWFQQKYYMSNPITNPKGISTGIPQFPILEWLLATTYTLLPNNSIELNTRLLTHLIGLLTLLFSYLFIKKISNTFYALTVSTLMATNQIIAFASFVTVYDGFNFMILVASLYFLAKYLENTKKSRPLLLAGILIGIGMSAKISLLIWALPSTALFILWKSKTITKAIANISYLYLFVGIIYLTTKNTTLLLKIEPSRGGLLLILGILILLLSYFLVSKYKNDLDILLKILQKKKLLLPTLTIFFILTGYFVYRYVIPMELAGNFLADSRLLTNYSVYQNMLLNQFIPFLGGNTFTIFIQGLLLLLILKKSPEKTISAIFLLTSIFFWVLASKSMFFHNYYTVLIMFALILVASIFIIKTTSSFKSVYVKTLLITMFAVLLLPSSISSTQSLLGIQKEGFKEAAAYLEENTNENDFYIDEGYLLTLTLETGRPRLGSTNSLSDEIFKEDVMALGFKGAMNKYNIKYVVTPYENPNYEAYIHIFLNEDESSPVTGLDRANIILNRIDSYENDYFQDTGEKEDLLEKYKIKEKFVFEKQIGIYRFFNFAN